MENTNKNNILLIYDNIDNIARIGHQTAHNKFTTDCFGDSSMFNWHLRQLFKNQKNIKLILTIKNKVDDRVVKGDTVQVHLDPLPVEDSVNLIQFYSFRNFTKDEFQDRPHGEA